MTFKDQFNDLIEPFIVLVIVDPKKYLEQNLELLKGFINDRKMDGIYITVNRSYKSLIPVIQKEGIALSHIFFIDLITETKKEEPIREGNCIFMGNASNLTDLAIAISQAVSVNPKTKKFIFLDSLSTMLIYNEAGSLSKFSHFLTSKLREWNVDGLFISLDSASDRELTDKLSQFCDKVVRA